MRLVTGRDLQYRGFHLDEFKIGKTLAQRLHDFAPLQQEWAAFRMKFGLPERSAASHQANPWKSPSSGENGENGWHKAAGSLWCGPK
jgi:hypothetical protein